MYNKILLPIHHIHDERILSGEKDLEIRKTAPSGGNYPYIIYMYETKGHGGAGAVVGFFKCSCILKTNAFGSGLHASEGDAIRTEFMRRACLSLDELAAYARGDDLYGLVVSTPIRFPRPRPLSDFGIDRAPQSWCYLRSPREVAK